jgi:hypothetical protein
MVTLDSNIRRLGLQDLKKKIAAVLACGFFFSMLTEQEKTTSCFIHVTVMLLL